MTHHRTLFIAATVAASLLLPTLGSNARAQPSSGSRATVGGEVRSLKAAYLRCERAAIERLLGPGDAANCSVIYEELLEVGFGGDFKRLLAWWRAERVAAARRERIATH
jgi:hypothetical protein